MARRVIYEKDKIVDRAFKLLKKEGMEAITARKLGTFMKTSPAPIYHSFNSMDELKTVLVEKAKKLFLNYINKDRTGIHLLNIGLGYCVFAREESNLFQNIFLNANVEKNLFDQFADLTRQELERDDRFSVLKPEVKEQLFFDCWTYAQGLATVIALGHVKVDDEELEHMLMRFPGYMLYKTLSECNGEVYDIPSYSDALLQFAEKTKQTNEE